MPQASLSLKLIKQNLKSLTPLIDKFRKTKGKHERMAFLDSIPEVNNFFIKYPFLQNSLSKLSQSQKFIIKSLVAIGQGEIIFQGLDKSIDPKKNLNELLEKLEPVETFYEEMGGVVGYHAMMLQLLYEKENSENKENNLETYFTPPGYDLSNETALVHNAIKAFLEKIELFSEIYPVGGAGDRLNLRDEKTGEDLPAAELRYGGKSLLEGLIRDLQAREYLHFKLFHKQVVVPIVMMTSDEKNNHHHILEICEKFLWFGRPRESFYFFKQPSVPVLTEKGDWVVLDTMKLFFKPGGHGVLWKQAIDSGTVDRLLAKGHTKALVRQINNPIAGTDYGLLAFCGCGILSDQKFGFASCSRLLNTAEGMNVLVERQIGDEYEYCISNVEYPDFVKKGIKEEPESPGSSFSAFPANTNILFADLKAIKEVIEVCPLPGKLINMKTKKICLTREGRKEEVFVGRLESLMQNIADVITKTFSKKQKDIQARSLPTFLTYNSRKKTISVTKNLHTPGKPIVETPIGCHYDELDNHYELFTHYCSMKLPSMPSQEDYLQKGPSFMTSFHPALGPLYSIIAQKIQGGQLRQGAEMLLEIAELDLRNVDLHGSLLIYAENIEGHKKNGLMTYSENVGRCTLKNVIISNRGINRDETKVYWNGQIKRHESLKIVLKGNSEFFAENLTFTGSFDLEVPDGHRMIARQQKNQVIFELETLQSPWRWKYSFDKKEKIQLTKEG